MAMKTIRAGPGGSFPNTSALRRLSFIGMSRTRWAKTACFIATTLILGPLSPLVAQSNPLPSGHTNKAVHVPFVGCDSDGQQGPQAAPKGAAKFVQIDTT